MPKMTANHLLASRALSRVQSILANSDALSEVVTNDYGEDLLVQTQQNGEADPFHILIQVKGTAFDAPAKDGSHRFRISVPHLFRWVSQIGSVLVCVYDDKTLNVFAFDPKKIFSLWDLSVTKQHTLSVKLGAENRFDEHTAKGIIWSSRIDYFSNLLALAENKYLYLHLHEAKKHRRQLAMREIGLICLQFLKMILFFDGDAFSSRVRQKLKRVSQNFAKKWSDDEGLNLRAAMMLVILSEVNDVTGQAMPSNLLEQATEFAGHMYKISHPKDWSFTSRLFRIQWHPYNANAD